MERIVTAILGGGQGSRLWPLTRDRAKPAVPVGGKFRLIDIPISNSLHAGIDRIFVITQFNSTSLHRHIAQTYRFSAFSLGYVNILAAEQTLENRDWFQGTADAVRQTLPRLLEEHPSEVLVLSGDQLYLMDISKFVRVHRERDADLTIAVKLVTREEASAFGILRLDATGRIVDFVEKPKEPAQLDAIELDEQTRAVLGATESQGSFLASMGIYIFRPEVLSELLVGTSSVDFGREVIPQALSGYRVFAFPHDGYWADIGTIPELPSGEPRADAAAAAAQPVRPVPAHLHPPPLPAGDQGERLLGALLDPQRGEHPLRQPHRRFDHRHPLGGAHRLGDRTLDRDGRQHLDDPPRGER